MYIQLAQIFFLVVTFSIPVAAYNLIIVQDNKSKKIIDAPQQIKHEQHISHLRKMLSEARKKTIIECEKNAAIVIA